MKSSSLVVSCLWLICYFAFKVRNCQHRTTAASSSLHITVISHIFHQKLPKVHFKDDIFLRVSHFLPDQRGTFVILISYIGDKVTRAKGDASLSKLDHT